MSLKQMALVRALKLPATLKSVLYALADRADDDGRNCYPSDAWICYYTGLTRTPVRKNIKEALKRGLIERQGETKNGRSIKNRYTLFLERGPTQTLDDFKAEFYREKKGTRKDPLQESEKGFPGDTERGLVESEKGSPGDEKGSLRDPDSSLSVHGTVHQPENADGPAAFISEMKKTFRQKTGKALSFISKKSKDDLQVHIQAGQEELWECWLRFLEREQGFVKLGQPVAVFLQELADLREQARERIRKKQRAKAHEDAMRAAHPEYYAMIERLK